VSAVGLLAGRAIEVKEAIRVGVRHRAQQDRVQHAEHRGVEPDAEREREHDDGREARGPQELADRETDSAHRSTTEGEDQRASRSRRDWRKECTPRAPAVDDKCP
jgi:hypothetical protein